MQDVHTDASLNGWLLTPAGNLVTYLSHETMIAGLTQRTMMAAEHMPMFLKLAQRGIPAELQDAHAALSRLISGTESDAAFAAEEIARGFNTIFSHHTVAMWGAVETTIEQTLVSHIRRLPDAAELIAAQSPTLKLEKLRTITERDTKTTIRMWEQATKADSAISRALQMLKTFDLHLSLAPDARRVLDEMSEIRNVIVHRAGFADERFVKKCPWVKAQPGDLLKVDEAKLHGYIDATHKFAISLLGAATKSKFIRVTPQPAGAKGEGVQLSKAES